jgi:hypothetical protein
MKSLGLLLFVWMHGRSLAFVSVGKAPAFHHSSSLNMAKRNKMSAKEKRKRRAKQLQPRPVTGKPVNFKKSEAVDTEPQSEAAQEQAAAANDDEAPPTERAKQLLEAQRKSVDMLTHVRERVEALDYNEIQSNLSEKGYSVIDNLLQRSEIIDDLCKEGVALFQEEDAMNVDLNKLGSGEYVCKIEGGEEQYKMCPRSVEFVVSMTKHMAPAFQGSNLDPSACMAIMRTYDKKAQEASLELLSGEVPKRPLQIVANEEGDARKITAFYFPTPGGGVTFDEETTIPAKRDRLFLLQSDTCRHRMEPWTDMGDNNANCIELHLIQG